MADDKTTVQISVATRDKLKILAEAFKRSQTGQLEWMVDVEYEKWEKVKLLPATLPSPQPASTEPSPQPSPFGRGGKKGKQS